MLPEERRNQLVEKYYRLQAKDLALFKFILEGYEGLAMVTTIDRQAAVIKICSTKDFSGELDEIITAVRDEFSLARFEPLGPQCSVSEEV